jgi:taurine ABC transporter substrate-binding protein
MGGDYMSNKRTHTNNNGVKQIPENETRGRRKFLTAILAIICLAGTLSFHASPSLAQSQELDPIRIGWIPDPNVALYVAWEKNYFEEAGLKPEFIKFLSGPAIFAALQSDSVDIVDIGLGAAIVGKTQGIDLKLIAMALDVSPSNILVAQKDLEVNSPADLRGKRIGSTKGSTPYYGLVSYLQSGGLTIEDVDFVNLAPPNIIPAFRTGEIDAAWTWSPWQNILLSLGGKKITDNALVGADAPEYWGVRGKFLNEQPNTVQRFLEAVNRGHQEAMKDTELAQKMLMKYLNVEANVARDMLKENTFVTLEEQMHPDYEFSFASVGGELSAMQKVIEKGAQFFHSQGFTDTVLQDQSFADPTALNYFLK